MEADQPVVDDQALHVPAIEVADLLSASSSSIDDETGVAHEAIGVPSTHAPTHGGIGAVDGHEASDDDEENDEEAWETESLYADALEGMGDEHLFHGEENACTLEEAHAFRQKLRAVGADLFVAETVAAGVISAKKLCTAFGIRPPPFLDGAPDEAFFPLLGLGISRELSKRLKLPHYNTVDDVVELLQSSQNIIVLTGAGISTSLGIPDFRSKETGLYTKLEHLGLSDPQEVFDIQIFREDPSIFYSIARDILPSQDKVSPTHAFIHLLQEKGKLLTNFSQNIDNLEAKAGIRPEKLIQCHGSFATATCVKCRYQVKGEEIYPELKDGKVAQCSRCLQELLDTKNAGVKRKRTTATSKTGREKSGWQSEGDGSDDGDYDVPQAGVMKPDITFFGEDLPSTFHDRLVKHDRERVDLVIVIGTSLKVAPVSEIAGFLPPTVPQVYISRTPVSHISFDVDMLGDCDVVVAELCRRAGWDLEHEMVPKGQQVEIELQSGHQSRHLFRVHEP
ncbi:MAG: NAD-dependent histone deacetylase sir2 [Thelocarpon superellum]|nr:MAG: NAD-dependent histone deacetylase sir2 [Thelocarpon superellum]